MRVRSRTTAANFNYSTHRAPPEGYTIVVAGSAIDITYAGVYPPGVEPSGHDRTAIVMDRARLIGDYIVLAGSNKEDALEAALFIAWTHHDNRGKVPGGRGFNF